MSNGFRKKTILKTLSNISIQIKVFNYYYIYWFTKVFGLKKGPVCSCKVLHRLRSENFNATAEPHFIFQVIGHHQWLTLLACVLMWGPSLTERLLVIWKIIKPPSLVVSVFLFLLGHTHNLLRSVLHAVFAQQIHSITWQGNQLDMNG